VEHGTPSRAPAAPVGEEGPPPPVAPAPVPRLKAYTYVPPPVGEEALSSAEAKHAPAYSLWLGGSLGFIAYGGGLYMDDLTSTSGSSGIATTGAFVTPGLAIQGDVGARLAKRYIPYLTLELGVVGAGHRFDQGSTNAYTSFAGVGVRFIAGDVDSVSFPIDVSFGIRKFQVSNSTGTWSASGLEIFRLGFGVEVRVSTRVAISPMLTLSGGSLTDTSGRVTFANGTSPSFSGSAIPEPNRTTYFAIVVGCGAHVDLLGR
jgi:hypothetical protein